MVKKTLGSSTLLFASCFLLFVLGFLVIDLRGFYFVLLSPENLLLTDE